MQNIEKTSSPMDDTQSSCMVDTRIQWLGQIPSDWQIMPLKRLCNISTGNRDTIEATDDGEYPFFVRSPEALKIDSYSYEGEAVLTAGDGDVGKIFHYVNGKYDCHQRVYNFTDFSDVSAKYAYYYLTSNFHFVVDQGTAQSTVPSLRRPMIASFPVAFPGKEKQQAIVTSLDSLCADYDSMISTIDATISSYRDLKQSIITEAVTKGLDSSVSMIDSGVQWIGDMPRSWNVSKIKHICEFNPSTQISVNDGESIGYVPLDVLYFGNAEPVTINVNEMPSGLVSFQDKDIIMAKVTPCFENGEIAIVDNLKNGVGVGSSELFVFRASDDIRKYLFYYLQSNGVRNACVSTMTGVAGLKRISPDFMANMKIPVPPANCQKEITNYLDSVCSLIDNTIDYVSSMQQKYVELKESIIYEYVTGKTPVEVA